MNTQETNLVVGAGITGITIARLIASKLDEPVLVIDRRAQIAGNCYDYRDANDIMIHHYGSHIFHTNNDQVWQLARQFASFNQYMHQVIALIDGIQTTIPFNLNTLRALFPPTLADQLERKLLATFEYNRKVPILELQQLADPDIQFLARYVYDKMFLHYTMKQWGQRPDQIDGLVTARVPVYISRDNRYFQDCYQGIPEAGYTKMLWRMLEHPKIQLQLNLDYKQLQASLALTTSTTPSSAPPAALPFKRIFYTGAIDEFFDYCLGQLAYRSLRFEFKTYEREFYQAGAVVNYPNNYDFTRIHEFKHYLGDRAPHTVIALEYPAPFNGPQDERYYPMFDAANQQRYQEYVALKAGRQLDNLYFLGRLGDFKYYNMDQAMARAMELFNQLIGR